MNVWGISDIGRVRTENQDAFFLHVFHEENLALAVVCDGMGGARAGGQASKMAVEAFVAHVLDLLSPGMGERKLRQALVSAVEAANHIVFEHSRSDPEFEGMGTTLVAAAASNDLVVVANVGDSRAYHVGENGIRQVTRDHSLVEDMLAKGDLTEEQARRHPSKNYITRALGPDREVECDLFALTVEPGDRLLLCSDGLSNVVLDQEILYEAQNSPEPSDCCMKLLESANLRGGPDNITMAMFSF